MPVRPNRRDVLRLGAYATAAPLVAPRRSPADPAGPIDNGHPFEISLAQWSLHKAFWNQELDNLDFAQEAHVTYGIRAVEYVNSFFKDRAADFTYLGEMKKRAAGAGVQSLLIMIDGEGGLAAADDAERRQACENHFKWIAAARFLGCHSIRVNAAGSGEPAEQMKRAADSLVRLAEFATPYELNVIVENHGGFSSNGAWLASVMKTANHPRVGTLPDFGNFRIQGDEWYDRYQGVTELMPYAKAVSAKSHDFDEHGNETRTDYGKMLKIVTSAGYNGFVGIEYEGSELSEHDGILATRRLLERVREELS